MKEKITRKDFLVNTSKAAVGITGVAALSSLVTTATVKANTKATPWPWPYQTIDPDEVRIEAHNLYWNDMDCCSGTFGGLVNVLAKSLSDPWSGLPIEIMLFGRGGGAGWGSLCGAINGGAAFISMVTAKGPSGPLITELWGWYCQEELPTVTANSFATDNKYLVHKFDGDLPRNIGGSPLCHVSVTEWCQVAEKKVGDIERKERCARIAGDVAAKTAELLNLHFAGQFTPTYVNPDSVTGCLACHGSAAMYNVMTNMECVSCHDDPHGTQSSVETISDKSTSFKLSQNYPNPFNPSTRIQFSIPSTEKVKLEIFDIRGKLVQTLVDYEVYQPGSYQVEWNGRDMTGALVSSGIYFTKMHAGKFSQTRKMSLVK